MYLTDSKSRLWIVAALAGFCLVAVAAADDDSPRVFVTNPNVVIAGDGEWGEGAYLGVQLEEETEYAEGGARITEIVDDSPADQAGLEEGDIIVRFDGHTIRGPVGLTKRIHATEGGDRASITVVRDGGEQTLEVEMGKRADMWKGYSFNVNVGDGDGSWAVLPQWNEEKLQDFTERMAKLGERFGSAYSCDTDEDDCEFDLEPFGFEKLGDGNYNFDFAFDCEEGDCGHVFSTWGDRPLLGVQLVETTKELRRHLGGADDGGVLISKVLPGMPAETAGIQVGDLIVSVDGEPVADAGDLRRALRGKRGETFDVEVVRDGRSLTLGVTIPNPDEDRPTGPRA